MQLFRQQAIDYQQRLYGEVLLVPPLRWSVVIGLMLILFAVTAAFLIWGSYSATIAVSGTSLPGDRVALRVSPTTAAQLKPGQPVRLLSLDHGQKDASLLHAAVEPIAPAPTNLRQSYTHVTARLISADPRAPILKPGVELEARIVLAPQPLLRWVFPSQAGAR